LSQLWSAAEPHLRLKPDVAQRLPPQRVLVVDEFSGVRNTARAVGVDAQSINSPASATGPWPAPAYFDKLTRSVDGLGTGRRAAPIP
jgi:hypothetical protein